MKKISIYIPTYNRLNLLIRAVSSVLTQDYKNFELIVVDDGSCDGTREYMRSMEVSDHRIRFIENNVNSGACYSRNRAINLAHGNFITGLDDDDYFEPDRLSSFIEAWHKKESSVVALCANSKVIVSSGKSIVTKRPKFITKSDLLQSNFIGNQIFAPRSLFLEVGGFDESFPAWQDYELWFRMLSLAGSKISCIGTASYVQDISHPHERISDGKGEKIKEAADLFIKKHCLSDKEKNFIKNIYLSYGFGRPSLRVAYEKLIQFKNWSALKSFVALLFRLR